MNDDLEAAFLQEIAEHPHDWMPRLILADWLEEQGDPRCEPIRLLHALLMKKSGDRKSWEMRLQALTDQGILAPTPVFRSSLGMEFRLIPPGTFRMGSQRRESGQSHGEREVMVTITRGFWLGTYLVLQSEWLALMGTSPWEQAQHRRVGSRYPAVKIDWGSAHAFCRELTKRDREQGLLPIGWEYQLPSEAQWEYACRAGTRSPFFFGSDVAKLSEYAWYYENARGRGENYAHEVGLKKPNPWGLYDIVGNADEWCRDWISSPLPGGKDPLVLKTSTLLMRAQRGGHWLTSWQGCRSAFRGRGLTRLSYEDNGFRVALMRREAARGSTGK